ncbi:hypothetical protein ACRAWG_07210 [Methylobacterium sp. P31]
MNKLPGIAFRPSEPEPLLTFRQAADLFGLPYWKIQRAAKLGLIPTVALLNSRRYVRQSEIERVLVPSPAPGTNVEQISFEFREAADTKGGSL